MGCSPTKSSLLPRRNCSVRELTLRAHGVIDVIWALLALLGVPIWLVIGALTGALVSRRRFRSQHDVFALSFREHGKSEWPRRVGYARYVHDVLLVNAGLALIRTAIHVVEAAERFEPDEPPTKLGPAVAWTLTLDDGRRVDIAVSADDAARLHIVEPSS